MLMKHLRLNDYDFGDFKLSYEIGEMGEMAILVPNGPRLPEREIIERLQKVGLAYQYKRQVHNCWKRESHKNS